MTWAHHPPVHLSAASKLKVLVGSGDRIALFALPVVLVGVLFNVAYPSWFTVGGPPAALRIISVVMLIPGVTIWIWSVVLILRMVPRGELITTGPYALAKHPLYTGVSFLAIPWAGFLLNTWLGVVIGAAFYVGSRLFAPAEEAALSETFGAAWDDYARSVTFPWL